MGMVLPKQLGFHMLPKLRDNRRPEVTSERPALVRMDVSAEQAADAASHGGHCLFRIRANKHRSNPFRARTGMPDDVHGHFPGIVPAIQCGPNGCANDPVNCVGGPPRRTSVASAAQRRHAGSGGVPLPRFPGLSRRSSSVSPASEEQKKREEARGRAITLTVRQLPPPPRRLWQQTTVQSTVCFRECEGPIQYRLEGKRSPTLPKREKRSSLTSGRRLGVAAC
ncbi:hypothetical protein HPB47_008099 [Ixodes persulcatus]|uniref:Uncharacterized protein n=1 Tax=Ixodes persulcatus TaxID=34615 RepID=A0AC60P6G6_IXOPE|nr:hypothetical protein HPB47_008099 [Ixodes persulcatus]